MFVIFLIFVAPVILYAIADLKPEIKAGSTKIAVLYIAMAAFSVVLCACVLRGVNLKSQSDIVRSIVTAFFPPIE